MDTNWINGCAGADAADPWPPDTADGTIEGRGRRWTSTCPIGNPQQPRPALAYRERDPGRLQLRVLLGPAEGICDVIVDEHDEAILVRVYVCCDEEEERAFAEPGSHSSCPVTAHLERPLGDRPVIDVDGGQLPLYQPE